jgi:antitoxin component YwqK of YwqJK toxin-antitoxin module
MNRFVIICLVVCITISCKKTLKQYYANGNVRSEVEYRKKVMHGTAVYYHANGNKQFETTYHQGKLNGQMKRWYYNGHIERIEHYHMDTLHGIYMSYHDNGNLHVSMNYEHGLKHGIYKEYHDNGQLKVEGGFLNDMFDGDWKYYDYNGIFSGIGTYDKGTGRHVSFHYNSSDTLVITNFAENLKHGKETWFEKNGTVKEVKWYEHGRIFHNFENKN